MALCAVILIRMQKRYRSIMQLAVPVDGKVSVIITKNCNASLKAYAPSLLVLGERLRDSIASQQPDLP